MKEFCQERHDRIGATGIDESEANRLNERMNIRTLTISRTRGLAPGARRALTGSWTTAERPPQAPTIRGFTKATGFLTTVLALLSIALIQHVAAGDTPAAIPAVQHPFTAVEAGANNDGPGSAKYDAGTHPVGGTAPFAHDFVLRNTTSAPVIIDHDRVGCGCTTLALNAAGVSRTLPCKVAPGEQITIHMSLDPAMIYAGPSNKIAWLFIPGQDDPAMTMVISVNCIGAVSADPTNLDFGNLPAGTTQTQTIKVTAIKNLYNGSLPVPVSSSPDALVVVGETPDVPSFDGAVVTRTYNVTIPTNAHIGMLGATIKVPAPAKTDDPITIFVRADILGDLSCQPGAVVYGSVNRGTTNDFKVVITGTTAQALDGLTTVCGIPDLKATIIPSTGSTGANASKPTCTLDVVYTPSKSGPLQSDVAVTTKGGQTLDIPVWGYVN